ncbi:MAG: glyoxylate/hydroxypyruvate reductase A [Pseudomonadota bacterium]
MSGERVIGLSVDQDETARWSIELERAIATSGRPLKLIPDADPATVDYLVYNIDGGVTEFSAYTRLRAILNTWAGVEAVVGKVSWPEHVPFVRMVETGMTEGMSEYFVGHTMRYLLDIDRAQGQSSAGVWQKWTPRLARHTPVGVLGLGELGTATAGKLAALGFPVHGWSRNPKALPGITCHDGPEGLEKILKTSQVLILILPLTESTRHVLNAQTLGLLPKGACIINAGRGPLIDDDALLGALHSGQVRHATLDVFATEPLPSDHPYWRNSNVTVTPHIAAETRFDTAAEAILLQIGRDLDGFALQHVVDARAGY